VGSNLVRSNLSLYTPSLWVKLGLKHLLLEAEGTFIGGEIEGRRLKIRSVGGVGRVTWSLLHDSLKLKFETGFASGDQSEPTPPSGAQGQTNYMQRPAFQTAPDQTLTNFNFDPDYHVDLILFRRLLGTVTNAIYWKPTVRYDLTDTFGGEMSILTAIPQVPVGTPGNGGFYGIELDTGLFYQNLEEGFYASFQWGVLFPGSALEQPTLGATPRPLYGTVGTGAGSSAQTVRLSLGIKF
jgi:uncharacterized protein (TIGR04551 family)